MKKSTELINLPVVSIEDGEEVGKIKDLIVNPKKAEVTALAISDDRWYKEIKVVSYALVCGVGEYAATVESGSTVVNLSSIPEIERLLLEESKIRGAKVITRSGKLIGEVIEYLIEEKSGKIMFYEITLISSEGSVTLPSTSVLTIGKDVLIVVDDVQDYFGKEPDMDVLVKKEIPPPPRREVISPPQIIEEEKKDVITKEEDIPSIEEAPAEVPPPPEKKPLDLAKLFEERKRKFVLGKIATRTIESPEGEIIVSEGEVITEDVITKAESCGKFTELSLNVKAGG